MHICAGPRLLVLKTSPSLDIETLEFNSHDSQGFDTSNRFWNKTRNMTYVHVNFVKFEHSIWIWSIGGTCQSGHCELCNSISTSKWTAWMVPKIHTRILHSFGWAQARKYLEEDELLGLHHPAKSHFLVSLLKNPHHPRHFLQQSFAGLMTKHASYLIVLEQSSLPLLTLYWVALLSSLVPFTKGIFQIWYLSMGTQMYSSTGINDSHSKGSPLLWVQSWASIGYRYRMRVRCHENAKSA